MAVGCLSAKRLCQVTFAPSCVANNGTEIGMLHWTYYSIISLEGLGKAITN